MRACDQGRHVSLHQFLRAASQGNKAATAHHFRRTVAVRATSALFGKADSHTMFHDVVAWTLQFRHGKGHLDVNIDVPYVCRGLPRKLA